MGQNSKGAFKRSGFDARINDDHFVARVRSLAKVPDLVAAVAGRLTQVVFENADALELIGRYRTKRTLLYADPLYLGHRNYYPDAFRQKRHFELLMTLRASPALVVISGYRSELYSKLLPDWRAVHAAARADTTSKRPNDRTETLWLNPAAAEALQR